jgi:hypothetical protein
MLERARNDTRALAKMAKATAMAKKIVLGGDGVDDFLSDDESRQELRNEM